MHQIQELAAGVLEQIEAGRTLTEALAAGGQNLAPRDRAALQDLGYGVLRHRAELHLMLRSLVPKPLPEARLERVLLVALYQIFYTRAAEYAIVNEAVILAASVAHGRFKGLVNGALRNALRRRETLPEVALVSEEGRFNHPQWWIDALKRHYPDAWQSILEASNAHPPMTLRVNRRKGTDEAYRERLAAEGIETRSPGPGALTLLRPVNVRELPDFAAGAVSVQDWGAQQAAMWLDLAAGQRVLDACAAPGGKSGHMLELADIDLTALDADAGRLRRVDDNLRRLGLKARLLTGDAGDVDSWWDGKPYDRILADVPCSASGVVCRHPDIKWLRRPTDFAGLARQQRRIIDALWSVLASGGKMLYATCSIFPEENAQQLAGFLERCRDARCLKQEQLLPTERHDGFYYALLEKI
ncbi:16S rRNA (cytosine(967)-C(5))-methyltransferase RsmB [Paludibacterium yongneupense]|uniref:16S rRNA (cytosine(967)-C(5))-methyltransferase RsmB n=1 Tax=Paludibacterium yongneupense TaxID=400061 RepID=UPI00048FDA30|nr:16S rRNA (cytosine(967)-C(5))-methyltransferase RsmB [Paludibacterium yongneupense]